MNEPASPLFEVLSGCYSGLTGKAGSGPCLIGSSLDADLVFIEQGLEPHHLRVSWHVSSIEIEALAANVAIEGRDPISLNEPVVVPLPAVIHMGTMSIRCSTEAPQQAGSTGRWHVPIIPLALVLISSAAVGTLSTRLVQIDSAAALSASSPAPDIAPKIALAPPDVPAAEAAAERLQGEVDAAGLLGVKIGSGPGVVTADGTITPASLAKWREIQQRFDVQSNGAYTLVSALAIKEEKAPPAIAVQAVWRGNDPYLVIAGQKYFAGALLSNGWIVKEIEDGRVLLTRNGQLAALSY
ncbi:hypothetical protein [Bradyrhizobium sp. CCBAU 53421]|uniref:SctD/MshK family protein n=1 Tax=Bradyrhizobium sp. CCBAU 53421 TaxID=1325120 RepID=UPI00188BC52C|nr:hypothetical protein [Bradyrhizobium sp. CCBAU 53421]